jgi:hypothetical protein
MDDYTTSMFLNLERHPDINNAQRRALRIQFLRLFIDSRVELIRMDMHLLNQANRITRVVSAKELAPFFGEGWEDILEEVEASDDEDSDNRRVVTKKPMGKKLLSMKTHWLSDQLRAHIPPGKSSVDLQRQLVTAMTNTITASLNAPGIEKLPGGRVLLSTCWEWRKIDSRSHSKQLPPIAQAAIQEYLAAKSYRQTMLQRSPEAMVVRQRVKRIMEGAMKQSRSIDQVTGGIVTQHTQFIWADDIKDVEHDYTRSFDLTSVQIEFARSARINEDQNKIKRFITSIENSTIARLYPPGGRSKKSDPIALEVRHALDHLLAVSILTLRRRGFNC